MPVVTPDGFRASDNIAYVSPDALPAGSDLAVDMPNDADPRTLVERFGDIATIRIAFPAFGDGRGFSLARQLRDLGYTGHLRAGGNLISDQYRHARQSGFDDVEIDDALAERQPEEQWIVREQRSYREKLAARERGEAIPVRKSTAPLQGSPAGRSAQSGSSSARRR